MNSIAHSLRALIYAACSLAAAAGFGADGSANSLAEAVEQLNTPQGAKALVESARAEVFTNLAYVKDGHERQRLDLYVPGNARKPMPLVCFIHGGGWRNGNKKVSNALPLLTQGYALAGIGYRLSDAAQFPAQIEDCKAAIRWLRANAVKYGIDPDRIGVWGPSAGGHLSALLGTSGDVRELEGKLGVTGVSSRVQAVCDFYGPTDFLLGDVGGDRNNPKGPVALMLGGPAPQRPEVARRASPANWISPDDPPFLIFQGGRDRTVPPVQSQEFARKLKEAGIEAELVEFPDAEHGGPAFATLETVTKVAAFFAKHLKPGEASR